MKNFKQVGTYGVGWNFPVISNGEEFYVVNEKEWNGEFYFNCWKCENEIGEFNPEFDNNKYHIKEVCQGVGEPDEDGDYDSYEVVDYEIYVG
ncbi:MAG: hypothetical protein IJA23_05685 [Clostridia bacterium]|nr:hypothetical protein [Clostridia bacterium]